MCGSLKKATDYGVDFSLVRIPSGHPISFVPSSEGGGYWDGRFDLNMSGPNGYTYGTVVLHGQIIPGYVCHNTMVFVTKDDPGAVAIGQRTELTVEERREAAESFPQSSELAGDPFSEGEFTIGIDFSPEELDSLVESLEEAVIFADGDDYDNLSAVLDRTAAAREALQQAKAYPSAFLAVATRREDGSLMVAGS